MRAESPSSGCSLESFGPLQLPQGGCMAFNIPLLWLLHSPENNTRLQKGSDRGRSGCSEGLPAFGRWDPHFVHIGTTKAVPRRWSEMDNCVQPQHLGGSDGLESALDLFSISNGSYCNKHSNCLTVIHRSFTHMKKQLLSIWWWF